jgi:pimeloyl-ACP methyl ester carboxylesterase
MLVATVRAIGAGRTKTVLIAHDWGAWIGYVAEKNFNRGAGSDAIDALVALDVGPGSGPRPGESLAVWAFLIVTYQWLNILGWFVGTSVPVFGPLLANCLLRSFSRVVMGYGCGMHSPTPWFEQSYTMSYPYWHAWRHGSPANSKFVTMGYGWDTANNVPTSVPSVPTLFLAGDLGVNLHGTPWREAIQAKAALATDHNASRGAVVAGCHHWLMYECSSVVNQELGDFVRRLAGRAL